MAKKTVKKDAPTTVPTILFMETANWDSKHVLPSAIADEKETSRAKFLRHVKGFDGKPVADWAADVAANAPAKSKNPKKPYTAKQWITWFVKAGVVEITDA